MPVELIVAIIGASGAMLGAIMSTISIILTNRNSKNIKILENSKNIKSDIAEERHKVYKELMDCVSLLNNIEPKLDYDYRMCPAAPYLDTVIFKHNMNSKQDIERLFDKISNIIKKQCYLDGDTLITLLSLREYIATVINYVNNNKIKNFSLFSYVVYYDILCIADGFTKSINVYLKNQNVLSYKTKFVVSNKKKLKAFYLSNFYNIYWEVSLRVKQKNSISEYNPQITMLENDIRSLISDMKNIEDEELKLETLLQIKKTKKVLCSLKKFVKHPPKIKKIKKTKMLHMWKSCQDCDNANCILNKNYKKESINSKK